MFELIKQYFNIEGKPWGPGYLAGVIPTEVDGRFFDETTKEGLLFLKSTMQAAIQVARETPYVIEHIGSDFTVVDCLVIGGTSRGTVGDLDLYIHAVNTRKGPIHTGHAAHYKAANVAITRSYNQTDDLNMFIAKHGKEQLVDIFLGNFPPSHDTVASVQRGADSFYSGRYNKWVRVQDWWTIPGIQRKWQTKIPDMFSNQ